MREARDGFKDPSRAPGLLPGGMGFLLDPVAAPSVILGHGSVRTASDVPYRPARCPRRRVRASGPMPAAGAASGRGLVSAHVNAGK